MFMTLFGLVMLIGTIFHFSKELSKGTLDLGLILTMIYILFTLVD